MAMGCHHDGHGFLFGIFLARSGETETCADKNFLKNFSPRGFLVETCAERNFVSSFSPRTGGELALRAPPRGHFAQVSAGNVRERAHQAPPRVAISRRFRLVTCASRRSRHDMCGEKLLEKLLSARVSDANVHRETLFEKLLSARVSASASRDKKEPSHTHLTAPRPPVFLATGGHHNGDRLPS